MKNKRLLIAAEYTSLGLSALGTILATVTGKVSLAATPLTLALSLNLINRKELTKETSQNIEQIQTNLTQLKNSDRDFQKHTTVIDLLNISIIFQSDLLQEYKEVER